MYNARAAPSYCPATSQAFACRGLRNSPDAYAAHAQGGIMKALSAGLASGQPDAYEHANRVEAPTLKSLMSALRAHDPYTYRHSLRTVRLSLLLGRACGVSSAALRVI